MNTIKRGLLLLLAIAVLAPAAAGRRVLPPGMRGISVEAMPLLAAGAAIVVGV